jgi:hypothetical protein
MAPELSCKSFTENKSDIFDTCINTVVLKLWLSSELPERPEMQIPGPIYRLMDSIYLGLRICISGEFPGKAIAVILGSTF